METTTSRETELLTIELHVLVELNVSRALDAAADFNHDDPVALLSDEVTSNLQGMKWVNNVIVKVQR